MSVRPILFVAGAALALAFGLSAAWEFALEEAVGAVLGVGYEAESARERWEHVVTATVFVAAALVVPTSLCLGLAATRKRNEEQLVRAKERAELASRAKSEFLANMSHELRTPLNAIIGFSEIIRDHTFGPVGNPKYVEYAKDINDSGQHLLAIISDILDLSKIEAGKLELSEGEVDVDQLVGACLTLVRERAEAADIMIGHDIPQGLPYLRADERKVKQIVVNLLSNAIKFTPSGGWVAVRAHTDHRAGLTITVADNGIGISPEDIPKAMTPFGQAASGLVRQHEGTGLGLPLTKALAELHGAVFVVESQVGLGTTVDVRFPPERVVPRRLAPPARAEARVAGAGKG